MKVGSSKPEEPAPMPAPTPSPEPEQNDGPPSDGGFGDDSESNSNDKPFNDEPFDAGVEADEKTDPKKFIEQLTGKLGQSLRKYNENQGQPDFELEKFALNSLISATHTAEMPEEDRDDIIKKINTSGKKDENNDNEPSDNESENELDSDIIIVDNGVMFEGTREQFKDCFFSNATNSEITDWCFDNGLALKINNKIIFK